VLRDPRWFRLQPAFMNGVATGSEWSLFFWWFRNPKPPTDLSGVPHPQLEDFWRRKWYLQQYHWVCQELSEYSG